MAIKQSAPALSVVFGLTLFLISAEELRSKLKVLRRLLFFFSDFDASGSHITVRTLRSSIADRKVPVGMNKNSSHRLKRSILAFQRSFEMEIEFPSVD